MTDTPTFLRRKAAPDLETGVRDILSRLRATTDREVSEVLAGATNIYMNAIIRFRGDGLFKAADIQSMFTIWQILLDVRKEPEPDYTSGKEEQVNGEQ